MPTQPTSQDMEERLKHFPPEMQRAVSESRVEEHIARIGRQFGLHVDQIGLLRDATYLVMFGFTNPPDFARNVAAFVKVPQVQAAQIAAQVDADVFAPMRASLENLTTGEKPQEAASLPPAVKNIPVRSEPIAPAAPLEPPSLEAVPTPQKAAETAPAPIPTAVPAPAMSSLMPAREENSSPTPAPASAPATPPHATNKAYSVDPYREPIEA